MTLFEQAILSPDERDTHLNTSFSTKLPLLQTYLDSTSLGEFKICPRRYYYSIIKGYSPRLESVHLTFGILLHEAIAHYWLLRLSAQGPTTSHESALLAIVRRTMIATWDYDLNRPWQSDHKTKNRFTLIRTIVWYLDKFQDDPIETLVLSNGKPAVELPFQFDSGYISKYTGESFTLCGHLDRLGQLNGQRYVVDIKSTEQTISQDWFDKFTPDNQFTIYVNAGKTAFGVEASGLIVDGCQISITFSRFQRGLVDRTPFQLEEWHDDLRYHLSNLDDCAKSGVYPQNDKSCHLYGGCPYRGVCSARSADSRHQLLASQYKRRTWDPLTRRGDI